MTLFFVRAAGGSAVAQYLKAACERERIAGELLGPDPARLSFVAR